MNDNNNSPSFLDSNTLLAIVLSFGVFIVWQLYMNKNYPNRDQVESQVESVADSSAASQEAVKVQEARDDGTSNDVNSGSTETAAVLAVVPESLETFDGEKFRLALSSKGMGFRDIELKDYKNRDGSPIRFEVSESALKQFSQEDSEEVVKAPVLNAEIETLLKTSNFATTLGENPLDFEITNRNGQTVVGQAVVPQGTVTKTVTFLDQKYAADVEIVASWSGSERGNLGLLFYDRIKSEKSSMFRPSYEGTDIFYVAEKSEERNRQELNTEFAETYNDVELSAIESQYFALVVKDRSEIMPKASSSLVRGQGVALARSHMQYASTSSQTMKIKYTLYFGPKDRDILHAIDPQMPSIIDYGFFGFLALPILKLLKFLYSFLGNWGFSIILLTVIIRLMLLPIAISSLRSMKKMQKIQPMIKEIKARYKDDPKKMNEETMMLMKNEGANPIGGCLPMFAQIPVFLALYSVLGVSIELYQAPFILWIHDLSFQDPYFVLPVLTAGMFFLQTKLTPSSMDPNQKKIMMFMPLIFGFFMMSLPAGLMAYFLTNNIFGIGQQFYINREKSA